MVKKTSYYLNLIRNKVVTYLWNKASKKSNINGICLVFHHIADKHVDTLDSCQCTTDTFKGVIEGLQRKGYTIIATENLNTFVNQHSNQKFAIITFDDVPDDMIINAYPYLKEQQIPFTVFITTNFIGKNGYLNDVQLRTLNNDPLCTIGAHTISHPKLRFSKNKVQEIVGGGDALEKIIGKKVEYFAFPFGSFYSTDLDSVRLASQRYKYSFSTIDADINDLTIKKTGFLPRRVINDIKQLNSLVFPKKINK